MQHVFPFAVLAVGVVACSPLPPPLGSLARIPSVASSHQSFQADCDKCHGSRGQGVPASKCLGCHSDLAKRINAGRGYHASASVVGVRECWKCHHDHRGSNFDMIEWPSGAMVAFNHNSTGFPLVGKHAALHCDKCHPPSDTRPSSTRRTFLSLSADCKSCHSEQVLKEKTL